MRSIPSCECLCSEFSLAQQKRTKEGLGPVLAGQRGFAHRRDMKMSGFIRHRRGARGEDGNSTRPLLDAAGPRDHRFAAEAGFRKTAGRKIQNVQSYSFIQTFEIGFGGGVGVFTSSSLVDSLNVYVNQWDRKIPSGKPNQTKNLEDCETLNVWLVFGMALGCVLFLYKFLSQQSATTVKGFKLHGFR